MIPGIGGIGEFIVAGIVLLVLIYGIGKKGGDVGSELGDAIHNFKTHMKGESEETKEIKEASSEINKTKEELTKEVEEIKEELSNLEKSGE